MRFNITAQTFLAFVYFILFVLPGRGGVWSISISISVCMYLNQVCIFCCLAFFPKLNSQKTLCSLICLCVFPVFYCEIGPPSLALFLVIGSSVLLSLLPLSSVSLSKAANGAWKWWRAYRHTLSLLCVAVCR